MFVWICACMRTQACVTVNVGLRACGLASVHTYRHACLYIHIRARARTRIHTHTYKFNDTLFFLYFRCEIRPGPEFILRTYHFSEKTHFDMHQYHYNDSLCKEPMYSIVARGRYKLGHESWIVRGGTEVEYQLSSVSVMAYTEVVAARIAHALNTSCDGFAERRLKPFQKYNILKYVQVNDLKWTAKTKGERSQRTTIDRDCTGTVLLP